MTATPGFDPALLRTFVALAETRSFTRAGERLGLSQPTVSQHVRRLETAAGRLLVERDTRAVTLTDNGDAMLGFARGILAAHDDAAAYFGGPAMQGRIRFGSADDLALTELPVILRDFRQVHPRIRLELAVNQSSVLERRLNAGQLDLVYVKREPDRPGAGRVLSRQRLVWVAHPSFTLDPGAPVPLVTYQAPSLSRDYSLRALGSVGRAWRITCTVREINGVLAALRAGIGIGVFPQNLVPPDLVPVGPGLGLPLLDEVDFALVASPRGAAEPVEALARAIERRVSAGGALRAEAP